MNRRNAPLAGPSGPVFHAGLIAALLGFGIFFDRTDAVPVTEPMAAASLHAMLVREQASPDVQHVAQWAIESNDHEGLPFLVVDKARARLFAFDAAGRYRASAPVLLGAARGDAPDVPATPAGRFVVDTWRSALGDGLVWVNDGVAVSLHATPSDTSPGRSLQRLASARVEDKRISDGSLHVADAFYREYLAPLGAQASVVYVLPEEHSVREMFTSRGSDQRVAQSHRHPPPPRRPS